MQTHPCAVVVGGGVSGLAAAYTLVRDGGPDLDVVLLEGTDRLGGKVRTQQIAGRSVDTGPDALLVRAPVVRELLDELDLTGAIVGPGASGSFLWSRERLRRLPPSTLFGIPQKLVPLLRSGLLSPFGLARAAMDLVLPRRKAPADADLSVGELVRPRFGSEVFDRMVDPLLGGVHAGRADLLSARSTVPEIDALARRSRSIYLAGRAQDRTRRRTPVPAGAAPQGPPLVSFDGGLGRLVDALVAGLGRCDVRLGTRVTTVRRASDGYRLVLADGSELVADAVVLATPAFVTADLLAEVAPSAAAAAAEVPYGDVANVTLVYPATACPRPLDGTGFLVPPEEDLLVVGCSWLSVKWPSLAGADDVLIRGSVGRYGDARFTQLDDDELVAQVHRDLVRTMGMTAAPSETFVQRWPRAMPQYTVGHGDRLARIDQALGGSPGLHVTGAAYRGVGIASCLAAAQGTAAKVLTELTGRTEQGTTRTSSRGPA